MKDKMTFSDLIDKIAEKTGATKTQVHQVLSESIAMNQELLQSEGYSVLPGFGRFSLKWHTARTGRNPQSGEIMDIPAHSTIKFTALPSVRNHINRKYALMEPELIKPMLKKEKINNPTPTQKEEAPQISADTKKTEKLPHNEFKQWIFRYRWYFLLVLILLLLILVFWPSTESNNELIPSKTDMPVKPEKANAENKNPEISKTVKMTQAGKISSTDDISRQKPLAIPAGKHRAVAGEYLYRLSKDYYQADFIWPLVFQANSLTIKNPDILPLGSEIVFPELQQTPDNLSEMDKKNLAEAYIQVYHYYKNRDRKKALHFLWVASKLHTKTIEGNDIVNEDLKSIDLMKGQLK
ncbi:MAG: HU family DNA-binding protein [Bacteroidales bacterium]|nr:HU family DNA-binding protein [Bacteroidales bacterium]